MSTIRQLTDQLTQDLQAVYPAPEAASVAVRLVEHLLGLDPLQRRLRAAEPVPAAAQQQAAAWLPHLLGHEPLQYVLGSAPFLDLDLLVTPATLIPRPETEELVQLITREQRGRGGRRILDVGTGSGCIPLALARALPASQVWGLDFSAEALAVARQNGQRYAPQVQWLQADILDQEPPGIASASLDVLVSNPPYVRDSEQAQMRPNVLAFEPHSALFVPDADPLLFYRRLAALGTTLLAAGGSIYFEINEALPEETLRLLTERGYQEGRWLPDLSGRPRMVRATWPGAGGPVQADDV
ncbi:peptide chain release factor N(5)-glutamine methyltransferase [Hymenobacter sp. 15J16-1T3B]|uniref:peptide chain release factor N(5)-glutamine methyltransferase n=1 Tax=Hymenobacter sp. 15J16-1T3B TaxID=2886941 RepID=UPI001D12C58C|nr:peptide chain release factor N(5)-glutamine methyltransferase [Hymenobacter sp. 15J16-1T3B]MCC3155965.1 peptide chain release factor N(5)-glutamine methyltransferase [Hymenobacter sp. 15J16-1T3B]